MLKRSVVKTLAAVSLSLLVLCTATTPAQAAVRVWGDPGASLWSSLVDYLVGFLVGPELAPPRVERKTTTSSPPGGTTNSTCPPGVVGCSNENDTGATADPLGKP